jgi:hypothetical protein
MMSDQRPPANPWVELWKTTVSGVVKLSLIAATTAVICSGLAIGNGGATIDYNGLSVNVPALDEATPPPAPPAPADTRVIRLWNAAMPPAPVALPSPVTRLNIPFLGIRYREDTRVVMEEGRLEVLHGAHVCDIIPGTPAERVGLRGGDLITGVDERQIRELGDLADAIRDAGVGSTITLGVRRDESSLRIPVRLARLGLTDE